LVPPCLLLLYHISGEEAKVTILNYDPFVGTIITSSKYKIDSNKKIITGIEPSTKVITVLNNLMPSENIKIYNKNGGEITGNTLVGTGAKIKLLNNIGVLDELTVVVYGDVTGSGEVTLLDVTTIYQHYRGKIKLTGAEAIAADVDQSGIVTLLDVTYAYQYYRKKINKFPAN